MELLVVLLVVGGVLALVVTANRRQQRAELERKAGDLAAVRKVADEDVTRFGEELQRLDVEMLVTPLDEPMRLHSQRALDSYEAAMVELPRAAAPTPNTHDTEALVDGRSAWACVLARREG
jgi:type II secretory pathway pseudopilin PulG